MASYEFVDVAGTSFLFEPGADSLFFSAGSAGQLRFVSLGAHLRVYNGNLWVQLVDTTYDELDDANFVFADGSVVRIGGGAGEALAGGAGGDWLDGRAGGDTMAGGAGSDTYVVDHAGDVVSENAGAGIDGVHSTLASTTLWANVENLWIDAAGAANGSGNALANTIFAGAGNNIINGGDGRDTVSYLYASGGVNVLLAPNTTTTGASGNDTLLSIENAVGSIHADSLTGNGGANQLNGSVGDDTLYGAAGLDTLLGGAGNDSLRGGAGADVMSGGAGNDLYHVDDAGDVVVEGAGGGIDRIDTTVSLTLGENIEHGRVLGFANIILTGNAGDNTIYGSFGAATLIGGGGHDTLSYALMPTGVHNVGITVNLTMGVADAGYGSTIRQIVDGFVDIVGSTASDILIGDHQANRIEGGDGGDFLYGYAGLDTLVGGEGADYYQVGEGDELDVIIENGVDDGDYIFFHFADFVVPDNIEFVRIGLQTGVNLVANASDNHIYDGDGSDTIDGLDGNDVLSWAFAPFPDGVTASLLTGVATHTGGTTDLFSGIEHLAGGGGDDHLTGDAGNNSLAGSQGKDSLFGGDGSDTLIGSVGEDELTGGAGADFFVYYYREDSYDNPGIDWIKDFDVTQDVIDISQVMSGNGIGAQDPFEWIGTAFFSADATGQLRYDTDTGYLVASTDADGLGEFAIYVGTGLAFTADDFIL